MIEIRGLRREDMREAIKLKMMCRSEETAGAKETLPSEDEELSFFIDWMNRADEYDDVRLLYGAFDDDKMLGVTFGSFVESKSAPQNGFELNGLWVYPQFRGRGVSLLLLLKLLNDFKRLGAPEMVVYNYHCAPSNSFYRHFGCMVANTEFQSDANILTDIFVGDISVLINNISASAEKFGYVPERKDSYV